MTDAAEGFDAFVTRVEPSLRRALVGYLPIDDVPDALAEAFSWAWQHWDRTRELENAAGFLFRVAQSKSRRRRQGFMPAGPGDTEPSVEPGLPAAFSALSPRQRETVWLVHGCGWSQGETGEALGVSASAVATHLERGLARLRRELGVEIDA